MFLSTVFTLFCLMASVPSRCQNVVPSAHIEGGDPRPVYYPEDTAISAWDLSHANSHIAGGFEFGGSQLIVPVSGRYYVYTQLYFNSEPMATRNRVGVFTGQRILLMIHKSMQPSTEETASAGGIFKLNTGERVFVKPFKGYGSVKLWVGPNHTYFGMYKVD
ncbi:unnamed protein product [Porites lobata]|uniref:THD domain-containing protein n=1 Tax=Porites lobata TaxID=104759 RepID=A0ABN8PTF7_9CNID|nr:unnamed protein product [Porites lobata]